MSPRRLRVDQALAALPETEELAPLRDALIGASREDAERAWAASEAYATLDTRLADPDALEAQVPALAERVRERVEAVLRHSVRALRAVEAGDPAEAARALVAAGEVEEDARRLEQAEHYYEKALALGRKPRDRRAEGLALRRLGRVSREKGELERALELYEAGFHVAEAQRDVEGAVVACQGMGNVYVDQGLWSRAQEWYGRGLGLLGESGPSRLLWQLCNNMAVVELRTGHLDRSEEWLERAEAAARALGDEEARVPLQNGRGRLQIARGELEEAEATFRRALAGNTVPFTRGSVLINLAEVLLLQGKLREAEMAARQLEETAVRYRVIALLPYVYRTLGAVARARGDAEGFLFYEQALATCREHRAPLVELATTQHEYGLFEAGLGRTESAVARLQEASEIYTRLGTGPEVQRITAELARIAGAAGPDGAAIANHDIHD